VLLDVYNLLGGSNRFDGDIAVAAVVKNDEAAMNALQEQFEGDVAVSHGNDGVHNVWVSAAGKIAELLVNHFDGLALVKFLGEFFYFVRDNVSNAAKFFVAIGIGGFAFENHFATFKHRAFGNKNRRVAAGIFGPVIDKQLGEALDIELVLGNDATVGSTGHGREHGGIAGVTAEHFDDHETLVRTGGGAEVIDKLKSAGDACAEADTVVSAGDVVVHGLGNGDDFESFFMEPDAVTECVIAADGDERVYAQPREILEDFGGEIVFLCGEIVFQMCRDVGFANAAGIGTRGMEKSAAGARRAVNDFLRKHQEIIGIVVILFADHLNKASPTMPEADDLIAFMKRASSNAADCWI
jgi:hypothetical protein